MSISQIIYKTTTKKLFDFKNVHKYLSHYQALFDKVTGSLTNKSSYTRKSTEIYFQATILRNIGIDYSTLIFAI